jgi:predicted ester cyclase
VGRSKGKGVRNRHEFHGLNATLGYVRRIRLAFSDEINVDLRELHVEGERARAKWVLSGTYTGKLGVKPRRVSFVIVVTYRLQGGLIREMLVSWDAMGLMRQIGLFTSTGASSSYLPPASPRVKRTRLSIEQLAEAQNECTKGLGDMFCSSSMDTMREVARRILDSQCVFQDSYLGGEFRGLEQCCVYANKVRKPFLTRFEIAECKRSTNEGAALGSPLRLDWTIKAVYSGPLAARLTECKFSAVVFVTFDETVIDSVHFSWNAPQLEAQLRTQKQQ